MRFVTLVLIGAAMTGASAQAETYDEATRAFLGRPEQQQQIQTALKAKAASLPSLCPEIKFAPADLFVKPTPKYDASGAMVEGAVRQTYRSSGCGAFKPVFNIWVVTQPGLPIQTIATVPGTTRAFIDLQRETISKIAGPARAVIPDCKGLTVVDTKFVRFDTPADDPAGPFRENWLVGGCGKLAVVPLHFVPNKAKQVTEIEVTGPAEPAELR